MFLESDNFVVDKLQIKDKENLKMLEYSKPWIKKLMDAIKQKSDIDEFDYFENDYFEKIWKDCLNKDHLWCIYRKDGQFCGEIGLDKEDDADYQLYIYIMDNARIDGFGKEMFKQFIDKIIDETGAEHLEFELFDKDDPGKLIFEELGIDMEEGCWIYDV